MPESLQSASTSLLSSPKAPALKPAHKLCFDDDLLRGLCLDSVCTFGETFHRNFVAARWHRALGKILEWVAEKKLKRVCISTPPRHGKSTLTSVIWPAWLMTRNPATEVMLASYNRDLSGDFSQKVKNIVRSPRYRHLMGDLIKDGQDRLDLWATHQGGQFLSTSPAGSAVGKGAEFLICDDLIKNREEANSPTYRRKMIEWFESTALTRLAPDGVAVVMMTRWHKGDLIGELTSEERRKRLLAEGLGDEVWVEINIEAICEHPEKDVLGRQMGEVLWPERWPEKALRSRKGNMTNAEWEAQFQGRPKAKGGNECDVTKLNFVDASVVPANLHQSRGWDLALGVKESNDYSAGARGGYDDNGNLWITDIDIGKRKWLAQKERIIATALAESESGRVGVEAVAAWSIAIDELVKSFEGRRQVIPVAAMSDKLSRATPWFAKVDAGKVFVVRGPWNAQFLDELEQFPNGAHDDTIDAVSTLHTITENRYVHLDP